MSLAPAGPRVAAQLLLLGRPFSVRVIPGYWKTAGRLAEKTEKPLGNPARVFALNNGR
jgi:hypothetical protein